jgi:hypothetical protein
MIKCHYGTPKPRGGNTRVVHSRKHRARKQSGIHVRC